MNTRIEQLLVLLSIVVAACADSAGSPDEVGLVQQGLGGFYEKYRPAAGAVPLHIGGYYTVFKHVRSGACYNVDIAITLSGERLTVADVPNCANIVAATSGSTVFIATSDGRIYKLKPDGGPGGGVAGSGPSSYGWEQIVPASSGTIAKLIAGSSRLYWQKPAGIYSMPQSGGTITPVITARKLLAVDGSTLYLQSETDPPAGTAKEYTLSALSSGGAEDPLYTYSGAFEAGFSFDPSYLYFVDNMPDGYSAIRRIPKSGDSMTQVKGSASVDYELPVSNGSVLYWMTIIGTDPATRRIGRKNLLNGNQISTSLPLDGIQELRLLHDGIYLAPRLTTSPLQYALGRTQL